MRNTKTARGSVIDMAALASRHETTRAVGNKCTKKLCVY